jgi:hypothetical protein
VSPAPTASRQRLDPDELAALEEQRDFLLASIRDLDAEREAGDLDDDDYQALKDDYTARAAEVLRAIEEQREAFTSAKGNRSRGGLIAAIVGVVLVAMVAGILVAQASGQRKAGDTVSGGVTTTPDQSAGAVQACVSKFRGSNPVDGIKCFDDILEQRPDDAEALTFRGWLLYQAVQGAGQPDVEARAKADITKATTAAPNFPIPHFFLAYIANAEGDNATAKAQLAQFDKLGGSAQGMDQAVDELRKQINGTATTVPGATTTVP